MPGKEDSVPLVAVQPKKTNYCRTTSCLGEPKETALHFLESDDDENLSSLLASTFPSDDDSSEQLVYLPLPEDHWIHEPYGKEAGFKSLLHLAAEKKPGERSVTLTRLLLSAGARADVYNPTLGCAPIHVAARASNLDTLKLMVEFSEKASVTANVLSTLDATGSSVFHTAAANRDVEMMRFLLTRSAAAPFDGEDMNGRRTPLYIAASLQHQEMALMLLAHGASTKNIIFDRTIEDLIREKLPTIDLSKIQVLSRPRSSSGQTVVYALDRLLDKSQLNLTRGIHNEQNFIQFFLLASKVSSKELDGYDQGDMTLLQKCCSAGLDAFAVCLLDRGVDPNGTTSSCPSTPLLIASYYGFSKIVNAFVSQKLTSTDSQRTANFAALEKSSGESILHRILSKRHEGRNSNYQECFQLLLNSPDATLQSELKRIVNTKDGKKYTPLHYATQLWSQETVLMLLKLGSNIGIKSQWGEVPISKILPETMETFLDDFCLQSKGLVTQEDFELTFNYSFLAPPVDSNVYDEKDEEGQRLIDKAALPETESLWYMSMSKQHRHLLKHPVITSFLHLKWGQIASYFNRNLRFYVLFALCSTWYIFERFGGMTLKSSSPQPSQSFNETPFCSEMMVHPDGERQGFWYLLFLLQCVGQLAFMVSDWKGEVVGMHKPRSPLGCVCKVVFLSWLETMTLALMGFVIYYSVGSLWYVITILIGLLVLRELFQMSVSIRRYCLTPENWLEIGVITIMAVILWLPDSSLSDPCSVKRHLAAVAIVLIWSELVTFVARHPRLSRYNVFVIMFYKVLKTFFFFLLWYSCFMVAFGLGFYIMLHKDTEAVPSGEPSEYPFFDSPFLSLIKTITMFVGEIEFSDLPIDSTNKMSPLAYGFLLAFVFLIIVVLMNLLNGLAVSDTGMIREKAEIVSHISRVDTISYIESLLLGDPFNFLSNWPAFQWLSSIPSLSLFRCLCHQNDTMRRLTLKLTGATGTLIFYSILPGKTLTVLPNKIKKTICACHQKSVDLPSHIIASAKSLIIAKQESDRIQQQSEDKDKCIENLLAKTRSVELKLEKIFLALNIKD